MDRRRFIQSGLAGLTAGFQPSFRKAIVWGAAVDGLILGLTVESPAKDVTNLVAHIRNVGPEPLHVYLSNGAIVRIKFVARSPRGHALKLEDRLLYVPCAGLCGFPVIRPIDSGGTLEFAFAFDNLLYVPAHGPYTTLATLFNGGFSIQASFTVADKDLVHLEPAKLIPERLWLGEIKSGKLSKLSHWPA